MNFSMRRLRFCLCFLASVLGCFAAEKTLFKITVQLDWVAEPEHGGFYQAEARGFFRDEGLDIVLVPGGPGAHVKESIATGQADVAQAGQIETLQQQAEGL